MEHKFLEAERKVNGVVQTTFDSVAGQAVVMGWNVPPENIPRFQPGKCQFTLKAAEATLIPSIWKAFGASANAGIGSLANKLTGLMGGLNASAENPSVDYQKPFRPVEVHTGIKVEMPRDEIIILSPSINCYNNGLIMVGSTVIDPDTASQEIVIYFYNILSTDITLQRGDDIANGYFIRAVGSIYNNNPSMRPTPIPNSGVSLNKN